MCIDDKKKVICKIWNRVDVEEFHKKLWFEHCNNYVNRIVNIQFIISVDHKISKINVLEMMLILFKLI